MPPITLKSLLVFVFSYLCITFGQPSGYPLFCILTSTIAFGLFFQQISQWSPKQRFWTGFLFFFCVQAVQLYWFTYHPFLYIWGVYILLCGLMGLQFGLLSLFATRKNLTSFSILIIPALWTLMEWSRLYWFSGFGFNPVGLALTDNIYTLQMASLGGMLGLSFWVMLTNTLCARLLILKKTGALALFSIAAILPYLFGIAHLNFHTEKQLRYDQENPAFTSLIVHQKALPDLSNGEERLSPIDKAFHQWKEIISSVGPHREKKIDLLLTPEGSVLFGSTSLIFRRDQVQLLFAKHLHYVPYFEDEDLCSADIAQELARYFDCPMIMGLEGSKRYADSEKNQYFNSAFFFANGEEPTPRYDKQILVPMGEYLPFAWAKKLVADYGVFGSFTPGESARLFESGSHKIGSSICYEETFSNLIRQNSLLGATMLVNLTDDYWFPYSKLAIQHFDHARPRTVENGIPLFRSCNFGISGAIDSLGRKITVLEAPSKPSSFITTCSSYHYKTLYSAIGDMPLIAFCSFLAVILLARRSAFRP